MPNATCVMCGWPAHPGACMPIESRPAYSTVSVVLPPNDSLPTAPSGEEQTDDLWRTLEEIEDFAYEHGLHEMGIPVTRTLRASLSTERARMERALGEAIEAAHEREASAFSVAHQLADAEAGVSRLTSELDRVRGALEKYGEHREGCDYEFARAFGCTCGLLSALGVTPDATTRREG